MNKISSYIVIKTSSQEKLAIVHTVISLTLYYDLPTKPFLRYWFSILEVTEGDLTKKKDTQMTHPLTTITK